MGKDLASSTEISLCESLQEIGVEVTLISPGKQFSGSFEHYPIRDFRIPGITTFSGSVNAIRAAKKLRVSNFDVLLIDWRYVYFMRKFILNLSIPWCIIDRGPPTFPGPLLRFQKKHWKEAWKIAKMSAERGFVVSEEHATFVKDYTGVEMSFGVVNSGTNVQKIDHSKSNPSRKLVLAYSGRIDERRGIEKIPELSRKLSQYGIKHEIIICGEGKFERELVRLSRNIEEIMFLGRLSKRDLERTLTQCHVGIMPMPDIPIWRISSPLKLSEYLSAGLVIVGPKHAGNMILGNEKWSMLSSGNNWTEGAVEKLGNAINSDWEEYEKAAVSSSINLDWKYIAEGMYDELLEDLNST